MSEIKPVSIKTTMENFDELLGQYWNLAYEEGKTGNSHGDKANEVLSNLRAALEASQNEVMKLQADNEKIKEKLRYSLMAADAEARFADEYKVKSEVQAKRIEWLQGEIIKFEKLTFDARINEFVSAQKGTES